MTSYCQIRADFDRDSIVVYQAYRPEIAKPAIEAGRFTDEWIVEIEDLTPRVKKIRSLYLSGNQRRVKEQLPNERVYPVPAELKQHLGIEA